MMFDDHDEHIHDAEEWKNEAIAVIKDVKENVKEIFISEAIPSSNSAIYCNITTLESKKFCFELTASGFR